MKKYTLNIIVLMLFLFSSGCASSKKQVLQADESQVKLRMIQTRAYDATDKVKLLRTVVSTLQDLDFLLEDADSFLGTVTGTKFHKNNVIRMTVSVRPRGETQLLVRANAQYGLKAVEDPEPYQDFFNALSKSLFLTAHQVD